MEKNNVVTVQTKEWANPTPAGLVAFAVACFCFFALLSGRVGVPALPLMGCWLLGGFIIQLVVAIVDLKGGNIAGGNVFCFFSGFFMLTGGLEMMLKYRGVTADAPLDATIDGFAWLVLSIILILWTPAFFKKFGLLTIVILLTDAALPLIAFSDLGVLPKTVSPIAAWILLGAGSVAIYLASALVVNGTFGKKIYPM
ncbi:MAG: GPR1/FUN34/YaaH family transporter [Clostridiales Family XIII bacterium]|jgi:succinate-acetate transporter protein|nr:GPR1/FUN34/YaaH family transporter [Clostridiales Family XIII bacterium]